MRYCRMGIVVVVAMLILFSPAVQAIAADKAAEGEKQGEFVKPGGNRAAPQPTATPDARRESEKKLKAGLSKLERSLKAAGAERAELGKQLSEARRSLEGQTESLEAMQVVFEGLRGEIEELKRRGEKWDAASAERAKAMQDLRMNMESLGKLLDSLAERTQQLEDKIAGMGEANRKAEADMSQQKDILQILRGDISNNDEDIAALRRQVQRISFDKSKQAGEKQNVDKLWRIAKHPYTALGVALVALIVVIAK